MIEFAAWRRLNLTDRVEPLLECDFTKFNSFGANFLDSVSVSATFAFFRGYQHSDRDISGYP